MQGKTVIVTGASTGIGKEIARNLARMGANVIMAVRTPSRGEAAAQEIEKDTGKKPTVTQVDFASQASIRSWAKDLVAKHPKIDVLVNNAGGLNSELQKSPDGIELTWATNVLGYHLGTRLLLDALKAAGKARIVNVASTLAGGLDLDDLDWKKRAYDGVGAYSQSKQANRMFTWALTKRLAGTGVTANAVHPGFVASEFGRDVHGIKGIALAIGSFLFARSVQKGARGATYLASSPNVEGVTGKFWIDEKELKCPWRDEAKLDRFWDVCEKMTADASRARE